jgi:signal peptidase I
MREPMTSPSGQAVVRRLLILVIFVGIPVLAIVAYVFFIALDADPAQSFRNDSGSMDSTLLVGERFTVRNVDSTFGIRRGHVVIFAWPPDRTKHFVKRVVGLPGDTLAMVDARLEVNGQSVAEPYALIDDSEGDVSSRDFYWQRRYVAQPALDTSTYVPSRNNWGPIVVPDGMYFVLGDNRNSSLDSRYWGYVQRDDIWGEVRRVYFSRDTAGWIRWARLARRVR